MTRAAIVYDCLFPRETGGGERVYRAIAEDLVARGFEVDYVTRGAGVSRDDSGFDVVGVWDGAIYDDRGVRTTAGAVAFARGVRARLRRSDYDVVVASALPVLTLLAARSALPTRTRLVADWLEVWSWRTFVRYSGVLVGSVAFVLQAIAARSTRFHTVNSSFTGRRLARYAGRARIERLRLVELGGAAVPAVTTASEPPYLLTVGRLIPDKRVVALPAALDVAARTIPGLRLEVVGVGPEAEPLLAEARRAGIEDRVGLHGRLSDEELDTLRAGALAHVSASRREGFGLVVVEAAARGLPSIVVAGDDNAAVELVVDEVNGVVAPDIGPDALAAAIVRVARDPLLRRRTLEWYTTTVRDDSLAGSLDRILDGAPGAAGAT